MNEKPASVEEKIISATIDCIEKHGISGATNRRIAAAAGVNLAAINYYFRSKDALIQRVIEITLKNAFDLGDMEPMPGLPAQERCIAIFADLLEGGLHYPGITRAHFHKLLVDGQYDALLVARINRFSDDLALDLHARGSALEMDELKVALMQIFSAVIMALLAPTLFERQPQANLHDPDARRAYVTRLVSRLLG